MWTTYHGAIMSCLNYTDSIFSCWGQHGAHLGPTGPRWAPYWPHELCNLGIFVTQGHIGLPLPNELPSNSPVSQLPAIKCSGQASQWPCFLIQQGCHTLLKHQHPCFQLLDWDISILPMKPRWAIPQLTTSDIVPCVISTLRPRQKGCRFADDVFKCIFLNNNV